MEVTFSVNGLDLHKKLSTYAVTKDITYRKVITTLDEIEHPYPGAQRVIITFSLLPLTDAESAELYAALRDLVIPVTYTNPCTNADEQKRLRVVSERHRRLIFTLVGRWETSLQRRTNPVEGTINAQDK